MIADTILQLLDKVKRKGVNSWSACCPAHDDRSPSLAIREVDDRILIHCFAGCSVYEVVKGIGLELSDLFPEKINISGNKPLSKPFPAADILHCLNREVIFLIVCAEALAKGKKLEESDKEKLYLSATRFRAAMAAGGLNRDA